MKEDTIRQLKAMYQNAKALEDEYKQEFPTGSYQRGYAHGIVAAYGAIFENLCAFEKANMFDD